MSDCSVATPRTTPRVVHAVLAGEQGPVRDIVLLNAAAGLVSFDLANDPAQVQTAILDRFRSKMAVAAETIDSGAAADKLGPVGFGLSGLTPRG